MIFAMSSAETIMHPGRQHPIQVVARRTGLSADVIRIWERRYAAVVPMRTSTNRRLYTDADIERLLLLRRATEGGRRIGDVAKSKREELESLVMRDAAATERAAAVPGPRPVLTSAEEHLEACLDAVETIDSVALHRALSSASVSMSTPAVLDRLLIPLLHEVGSRWREGTLRPAHEHMATATLRSFLAGLTETRLRSASGPAIVVTTPLGQLHDLGAMMAAVTAALEGWRPVYIGTSLDADEISSAARHRRCRVVALSIVHPPDDPRLPGELRTLRRKLPTETAIIAGGEACESYRRVLAEIGAKRKTDFESLRLELEPMRSAVSL
jgi:DNA-binding transcriptional MerR regulator/methylmalonyl-CoA mutase cobalamin-binding subunit